MRIRILLAAAAVTAAAAAAVATAAPTADSTIVLSAASPEYNWDGQQTQSVGPLQGYDVEGCAKDPDYYCEIYLLDVQSSTPVTVDASLTQFSNPLADWDLRVYKSNEAGTAPGEEIEAPAWDPTAPNDPAYGGPNGFEEIWHAENVAPGKLWLVVHHYFNPGATYKGNVKITGATGGAATPTTGGGGGTPPPSGGGGTPPPSGGGTPTPTPGSGPAALPFKASSTLGSAKKAKKKKSLSFKGTASQDITNLTLTLLDGKKKKVGSAKIASFPKGSKTIKLKVSKKIKAGKYQLAATGTVNGQQQSIVQPVKVKK